MATSPPPPISSATLSRAEAQRISARTRRRCAVNGLQCDAHALVSPLVKYIIEYSAAAAEQLAALSANERRIVVDEVDRQLPHEPTLPTRKRKKLRPNLLADWELRIGNLRIYYVMREPPNPAVSIVAIGKKVRNQVFIGGIEVRI